MELCLFTCPGPSDAIHAPHHQNVSAHGSQPSGPVVPLMSPETSRSPLVFVAHLSFCVFSHPYSPLQDAPSESPTVQPTLAKEAGRGRAVGQRLHNTVGLFPVPTGIPVVAPGLGISWSPHSWPGVLHRCISELSPILLLAGPCVLSQ